MLTDNENSGSVPKIFKQVNSEHKLKLSSNNKNMLLDLPFKNMQNVCHMLGINDMWTLAATSKKMQNKMREQEDMWKVKMFK